MMRDHRKLEVFDLAREAVLVTYKATTALPSEEKFGLQSQIRRAAVSVPTNIVEGCSYSSEKDFARFLRIAHGSASEARFLLELTIDLEFLNADVIAPIVARYDKVVRALANLLRAVEDRA